MRAGLLSDGEVIRLLNKRFVCTTVIIDDARKRAESGDVLAKQLAAHWRYPVELMFLASEGASDCRFVSRLNSFEDFVDVHPDVAVPRKHGRADNASHVEVFLKHIAQNLSGK